MLHLDDIRVLYPLKTLKLMVNKAVLFIGEAVLSDKFYGIEDFWGNIGWGATEVEYEFVREDDFGEAEINNLNTFEAIGRWVHLH